MAGLFCIVTGRGHLLELLVDLAGAVAGLGELGGLGEGLADGFAGVGDLAVSAFGCGLCLGFAFLEDPGG